MIGRYVGQAVCSGTGAVIVEHLYSAETWWSRFRGLQLQAEFPVGCGLLLSPCSSIHMFWMRFPIDLMFLSTAGVVVEVRRNIRPWTVAFAKDSTAAAALEVPVESKLAEIGELLQIVNPAGGRTDMLSAQRS